jgi:hypothetical protein
MAGTLPPSILDGIVAATIERISGDEVFTPAQREALKVAAARTEWGKVSVVKRILENESAID